MTDTLPRTLFWFYSLTAQQTTLYLQYTFSRYLFDQEMKKRNQNPAVLTFSVWENWLEK